MPTENFQMNAHNSVIKIAKIGKPPKSQQTGEEINKMWYTQTMEYTSNKKDETLKYATTWMSLKKHYAK